MLLRKAVVAVGLAVALTGVGPGTAVAASDGDTQSRGADGVVGGVQNTLSNLLDGEGEAAGTGTGKGSSGQSANDPAEGTAQGQDEPLLDVQGACADGSPAGDAEACESETLNNGYLNACVRADGGVVSDLAGGEGGVAEQTGLDCTQRMPPPEDGKEPPGDNGEERPGDNGDGPDDDDGPTPMPPPVNRADPASPAEPISAQPSFTG